MVDFIPPGDTENQPEEFERRLADDIARWQDDPNELLTGVMRYFGGDKCLRIITVFDNADRRDGAQQLSIFQAVQHYRTAYRSLCILALRDETFDRYRNEPPLDAFFKHYAFRINPPRFLDVIKRRLELIISDLNKQTPNVLSFQLPNGIEINYPGNDLGKYLFGVYRTVFTPSRKVRVVLEAIAGRNVRRALEMFSDLLISGHMIENIFLSARYNKDITLPEYLVIRILMRTKYRFFTDDHGYITNLFAVNYESASSSNFLLMDILQLLSKDRKKIGELNIEGYRYIQNVIKELSQFGYLREDIIWGLEYLLKRQLITADNQASKVISLDNYVRITASGHYHLTFLLNRSEYLSSVCLDTWLRDKNNVQIIADYHNDGPLKHVIKRLDAFIKALQLERDIQNQASTNSLTIGADIAMESLETQIDLLKTSIP